jgi:WD40 repeat protein/class 3 adenylate cyclase/tRNA A-37 threonylcarbamoyl transferase component Bud32
MADGWVIFERQIVVSRLADRQSVGDERDSPASHAGNYLNPWLHQLKRTPMSEHSVSEIAAGSGLIRGRYEPLVTVGWGGEARVVKALDHQHQRYVALKIRSSRGEGGREQLLREARLLLGLPPHPALPLVREDFFIEDEYIVVMDWVDGTDLGMILRDRGTPGLAPSSVVAYVAEASEALTFLHSQDPPIIHGDVKPRNLILTRGGHVKLVDFGLSSTPGGTFRRAGTPGYRAPELAAGEAPSRASDVYALAATAFTLLSGAPPAGVLPVLAGLEPAQAAQLTEALRLGLATDPERRPATPGELVERLRAGWSATLPTGILTFCLTDIVGSTSLWESNPGAMAQALVRHDELLAQAVEASGGRFVKAMGEGDRTVSVFESASDAVRGAIAGTSALAGEKWPAAITLRVRCGIHTGEAERRSGNYFGPPVNLAARLRAEAEPGEILLSGLAAELVTGQLPADYSLVDLGSHRLRGVQASEQIYAISGPGVTAPVASSDCPYRGLFPFGADDRGLFFGREDIVRSMLNRLSPGILLALVGASGSGKSSVLRAGLVAATEAGEIAGITKTTVIQPGPEPPSGIAADAETLVVVDQFEELYTVCRDADRRNRFIDWLLSLPGPVAIGVRADFYGDLSSDPGLARAVASNHVLLGAMSHSEMRRAVVEPADVAGLRLEPGLVEVILAEVGGAPGTLPLLSHALRATWERREGRTLTIAAYRATGRVASALAQTADTLVATVPPERRWLVRNLFQRLTEIGDGVEDTRRRVPIAEIVPEGSDEELVKALLDRFANARLITIGDGTVEVAHEVLIREWPTLRGWLDEDREGLKQHRRLGDAAQLWDAAGREPADLYRGPRLAAALDWARVHADSLNRLERSFLDASRAEADQERLAQTRSNRRLRAALGGVGALLFVAILLGVLALRSRDQANQERTTAQSKGLAAESTNQLSADPELAVLLAREAVRREATPEAMFALRAALDASTVRRRLPSQPCPALGEGGAPHIVSLPSGRQILETACRHDVTVVDTASGRILRRLPAIASNSSTGDALPLAINARGTELAVATGDGIRVIDPRSGKILYRLGGGTTDVVAFSSDGRLLATHRVHQPLTIWDLRNRRPEVLSTSPHDDYARVLFASGDRKVIVATSTPASTGAVYLYDRATGRLEHRIGDARTAAISADGSRLAVAQVGHGEGSVTLWDPRNFKRLFNVASFAIVNPVSLAFAPEGDELAIGLANGSAGLWSVTERKRIVAFLGGHSSVTGLAVSPDGREVTTAAADGTTKMWSAEGGREVRIPTSHGEPATMAIGHDRVAATFFDGSVGVWNITSGRALSSFSLFHGDVFRAPWLWPAVSPDGSLIAFQRRPDGAVQILNADTRTVVRKFAPQPAYSASFSQDNDRVAVFSLDSAFVASIRSGAVVPIQDARLGASCEGFSVGQTAFSSDGRLLAASTSCDRIGIWDTGDGRLLRVIRNPKTNYSTASLSANGSLVAMGSPDTTASVWSVRTGRRLSVLHGHSGTVVSVAFDPSGTRLASASVDGTVRIWDVAKEQTLRIITGPDYVPEFSTDGHELVVSNHAGTIEVWPSCPACGDVRALLATADAQVTRDFTPQERRDFLTGF